MRDRVTPGPVAPGPVMSGPVSPSLVTPRRLLAGVVLLLVLAYALVWPLLAPPGWAGTDYLRGGLAPSWPHLMGADALGHDLSVRVAQALRVSLAVAAGSALAAVAIGVAVGAAASAGGGRVDGLLMRVTDAVAAVPHLLATIVVVAMFRGSVTAVVLALALTHWPSVARIVRAETQKVMSSGYVAASRAAGASPAQLVRHHVLPAVAGQAGLAVVMMLPHAVWHESTLSFLGIGLPPERASLGTLISLSRTDLLLGRWWALAFPAVALIVVTVAVALLAPARRRRPVRGSVLPTPPYDDDPTPARNTALAAEALTVQFPDSRGCLHSVLEDVSLSVPAGGVMAVVGESGAGKSTLADAWCGLLPAEARVQGRVVGRGTVGHVPQSTSAAFTPTRHVRGQLDEILAAARRRRGASVAHTTVGELCAEVGLDADLADRYPHQLSGGQRRRAAIAAALATCPAALVVDEPTAGLDPGPALAILRLLRHLADERGMAVVVVTHDLAVLGPDVLDPAVLGPAAVDPAAPDGVALADHVAVLRDGRLCELGPAAELLTAPAHPYTRAFVGAARHPGRPALEPVAARAPLAGTAVSVAAP